MLFVKCSALLAGTDGFVAAPTTHMHAARAGKVPALRPTPAKTADGLRLAITQHRRSPSREKGGSWRELERNLQQTLYDHDDKSLAAVAVAAETS